jgi:hypothetical protein
VRYATDPESVARTVAENESRDIDEVRRYVQHHGEHLGAFACEGGEVLFTESRVEYHTSFSDDPSDETKTRLSLADVLFADIAWTDQFERVGDAGGQCLDGATVYRVDRGALDASIADEYGVTEQEARDAFHEAEHYGLFELEAESSPVTIDWIGEEVIYFRDRS